MKILLVSASPHKEKSRTFRLAKEILRGAESEGCPGEIAHLADFKIGFCLHCDHCHRRIMNCPVKDDAMALAEKMLAADGLILATPNYLNQVTASMKALFDRAGHFIHCKRLTGKFVAAAVTSGSGCDIPVLKYLKYYAHICGGQYSGGISSAVPVSQEKLKEAFRLGRKLASDLTRKRQYRGQVKGIEKSRVYFGHIIERRKDDWKDEYEYWKKKGWL